MKTLISRVADICYSWGRGYEREGKNAGTLDLNTNFPKLSDLVSKVVDVNIMTNEAMESTVNASLRANDDGVAAAAYEN
ncbi:hypothetical protein Tco_0716101, partial [Tanacetum coccineum]